MHKKIYLNFVLLFCLCFNIEDSFAQAPMTVTTNLSAQDLVEALTGSGVTTLNPQMNCPTTAIGTFEVTGTNTLGIDSGLVLSTGHVNQTVPTTSVVGPNNGSSSGPSSITNGVNNDPDLMTLVNPNTTLRDGCILEFDFIPIGDSINFDFVFASSEYWSFSCSSYNDVFGFFVSGPGITGTQNIALVPGTNIPIMVNSTTGVASTTNCTSLGPGSPFSQYYNDNRNGPTTSFGGFTDVFTAKAAVQACDTYHLKLAISDMGDSSFDSAVFLKSGSLSSIGISTSVEGTAGAKENEDHCIRGCKSATITVHKNVASSQDTHIDLQFGGTAVNGVDYSTIPSSITIPAGANEATIEIEPLLASSPTGPREAIIYFMSPYICHSSNQATPMDSAVVTIYDSLYAEIVTPPTPICKGDTIQLVGDVDSTLSFSWQPSHLVDNPNNLTVNVSPSQPTTFKLIAKMEGAPSTCPPKEVEYFLQVDPYGEIVLPENMDICLEDSVSLNVDVLPDEYNYEIRWEPAQYFRNTYDYKNMFWAPVGRHTITVEATSPNAQCKSIDSMIINVQPKIPIDYVNPKDTVIKYGETITLEAHATGSDIFYWDPITYLESPSEGITQARPLEDMTYRVVSLDPYGCRDTAYVNIIVEYKSHLTIPNAFTPDGDGLNDVFKIVGHEFERLLNFSIYNRYGQEVFHTQDINKGWDGTIKGELAKPDTYIYVIEYALPGNEVKMETGDVVLLR